MNSETFRFRLGTFSCIAIKDGVGRYPIGMFLTNLARERYEPELLERGEDPQQWELPFTCLFIDTGRERVLVDTGYGGRLASLLRGEGIKPGEVTTVILSHGHEDHIEGCLNEAGKPAFPNARYVMFRKEWDYWMSNPTLEELPVDDSFKKKMLASARRNLPAIEGQLEFVDPDTEIVPGVIAITAFGHSPGQMGLEILSAGERLLFLADAVVLRQHLEYPEAVGCTDHLPSEMITTRIKMLEKAAVDKLLVSTSHLPFPGLGYVVPKGKRWAWQIMQTRSQKSGAIG